MTCFELEPMYNVVRSVAHNINYIQSALWESKQHEKLKYRIMISGHGRTGKDTAATILADMFGYRAGYSTSFAVLPLVCYSLHGCLDLPTQEECYAERHKDRTYWYNYCNMLRVIDPHMLIKLTLAQTDFIVGTRDKSEFVNALDFFKPNNVLWMEREGVAVDPTMDYDRSFVAAECNKRLIRHTTVGNNDSVDVLTQQLQNLVKMNVIVPEDYIQKVINATNVSSNTAKC